MISVKSSGASFKIEGSLNKLRRMNIDGILKSAGAQGVAALRAATPIDSGLAADSWGYEIRKARNGVLIVWTNSDVESGFPVVIALQYGYSTGTGGYVSGRDFINPAMRPVFDRISNDVWKAVTNG